MPETHTPITPTGTPPSNAAIRLLTPYVVGYIRVSSAEQVDGWSLAAQEGSIRDFAASQGWTVVEVCSDPGRSGGSVRGRHGLARMLELVRGGQVGAIMAWREDRLSRQVVVARHIGDECARAGCAVISLDPILSVRTAENVSYGTNILPILQTILAENERDTIRRRVLPGISRAFANGRRGGRTPLGYRRLADGTFEVHTQEAAMVRRWYEAVAGGTRVTALVRTLAADGVVSPAGAPYSIDQIRGTLTNPFLIGDLHYTSPRGTAHAGETQVRHGHHDAIIPKELFLRVGMRLQQGRRREHAHGTPSRGLLRSSLRLRDTPDLLQQIARPSQHPVHGIAPPAVTVCATCGGTVYATLQTRGSRGKRHRVPIYLCRVHKDFGSSRCTQGPVLVAASDSAIHAALLQEQKSGRWRHIVATTPPPADVAGTLAVAEQRLDRVTQAIAGRGEAASPSLRATRDKLTSKVAAMRERAGWTARGFEMPPGPLRSCLDDFDRGWIALSAEERRRVVAWACTRITIAESRPPIIVFAIHLPAVSA